MFFAGNPENNYSFLDNMGIETVDILKKALEMFNNYGVKSVSMDDIAGEFGISKKTLYQYIKDKNDLVAQCEQYRYEDVSDRFERVLKKDLPAVEEIVEIHSLLLTSIESHSQVFTHDLKKYYRDMYTSRFEKRTIDFRESVTQNLNKGIEEGVYRSDLNADYISEFLTSLMYSITQENIISDTIDKGRSYYIEVFQCMLLGILNDKGKKQYYNMLTIK